MCSKISLNKVVQKGATQNCKFNGQQSYSALSVLSNRQRVFWNLLSKFYEKLKIKLFTIENNQNL